MRSSRCRLVLSFAVAVALVALLRPGLLARQLPAPPPGDVQARSGFDPTTPLASRVGETPASVLALFDEPGQAKPTPHTLTEAERRRLAEAFESLPPLLRRTLARCLRTVSFLDGMPNTALTSVVNPGEPVRLYDLTIRAGTLSESASTWLSWKERTIFDTAGSGLSVAVDAGPLEALRFILLHEATHMVDGVEGITPPRAAAGGGAPSATPFTEGVWAEHTVPVARYRDPLLESVVFRNGGRVLPIAEAPGLYAALRKTPFVSVYGSTSWSDDLAELVAVHHWTEVLRQPYRVIVRDGERVVDAYEPATSALVRQRFVQLKRFYDGR